MIDDYDQQDVLDLAQLDGEIDADLAGFDSDADLDDDEISEPAVAAEQVARRPRRQVAAGWVLSIANPHRAKVVILF